MASQAPIKVNEATKEKIRYLAAFCDLSQAGLVEKAINEFAVRHGAELRAGIDRARAVLAGGDADVAAYLLDEPTDAVRGAAGGSVTPP
jgi:predicted transcriptional regulator